MARQGRLLPIGTPTQKRCARCSRKISPKHEHEINGKYYGSECVQRVLDQLNSRGKSE